MERRNELSSDVNENNSESTSRLISEFEHVLDSLKEGSNDDKERIEKLLADARSLVDENSQDTVFSGNDEQESTMVEAKASVSVGDQGISDSQKKAHVEEKTNSSSTEQLAADDEESQSTTNASVSSTEVNNTHKEQPQKKDIDDYIRAFGSKVGSFIKTPAGIGTVAVIIGSFIFATLLSSHIICFHDWSEPTCEQPAACSICGKTNGDPAGHQWADATCTNPKTCSVCGKTSGKKLDHHAEKWITDKEATCTKSGEKHASCDLCGEVLNEEIEPLGHDLGDWEIEREASCAEVGEKHAVCKRCNKTITEEIPLTENHTEGEWEITKASGIDDAGKVYKGEESLKCQVCGKVLDTREYSISEEEALDVYKSTCEWPNYADVARDPNAFDGKRAAFRGKVIQVVEGGTAYNTMLVEVTEGSYGIWNDMVYVEYSTSSVSTRILEDDIITMYGVLGGTQSYTTVLGAQKTIPFMLVRFVELG